VVDEGGVADEQGVELGQPAVVAAGDEGGLEADGLGGLLELLDGTRVGRGFRVLRVDQDGQVIARQGTPLEPPRTAGKVVAGRLK